MVWFLIVLFESKTVWNLLWSLKYRTKLFIIIALSAVGMVLGRYQYFPFSLDIALSVLVLFLIGEYLKRFDLNISIILSFGLFFIWILMFGVIYILTGEYLELAVRHYPLLIICYIPSASCVIFLLRIGLFFAKYNILHLFGWIGKHSMIILSVHYLDVLVKEIWMIGQNQYCQSVIRVFWVISITYVILGIKRLLWPQIAGIIKMIK